MTEQTYNYYNRYGGGYFGRFIKANPEFNIPEFRRYVESKNKGDRDSVSYRPL